MKFGKRFILWKVNYLILIIGFEYHILRNILHPNDPHASLLALKIDFVLKVIVLLEGR